MFDNVIVGVDGPEGGRDALWLAQQIASGHSQLTLAHVEVVTPKPGPTSGAMSQAEKDLHAMQRLMLLRDEAHVDAHLLCVEAASVAAGFHELVARHDADVLVIGASRRDDYERAFVGDDVRAVLEHAPCPVAIAPRGLARRASAVRKIGAGYDGSAESEQALALARVLARERGAELSAFQAVPESYVHNLVDPQPEIEAGLAEARTQDRRARRRRSPRWSPATTPPRRSPGTAPRSTCWWSARTDTGRSTTCCPAAPPSGSPTMPRARCSCWRRNDLTPRIGGLRQRA